MIKDRAKKTSEAGNHYHFLPEESCTKTGEYNLSENRRPEMIAENGRFPAETGGLVHTVLHN